MNKKFTLGEIYRLGLLKTKSGEPYKNKATISKTIKRKGIPFKYEESKHGTAMMVEIKDIDKFNDRLLES